MKKNNDKFTPPAQFANQPTLPDNPAGIEWVEIPAGEFLYGEKKEKQYLRRPFLIGKFPVTNGQYMKFLDANQKHRIPSDWDAAKRQYPSGKEKHPVVNVSWQDACTIFFR